MLNIKCTIDKYWLPLHIPVVIILIGFMLGAKGLGAGQLPPFAHPREDANECD